MLTAHSRPVASFFSALILSAFILYHSSDIASYLLYTTLHKKQASQPSHSNMRASLLPSLGAPQIISEIPKPIPSPSQLLVHVSFVGLNQHDVKMRDRGLFIKNYPAILGSDISGIVSEVGSEVHTFKSGDRVMLQGSVLKAEGAGCQEYCVVEASLASLVPENMKLEEVATLPVNLAAAFFGFFAEKGFGLPLPGSGSTTVEKEMVLVSGGASHTGRFGLQIAKIAGFGRIVTTATVRNKKIVEELKKLGATDVIDRTSLSVEELATRIRQIVGDELIYAYDPVSDVIKDPESGHRVAQMSLSESREGGKLVTLTRPGAEETYVKKKVKYSTGLILGVSEMNMDIAGVLWDNLKPWLEEGKVVPARWEDVGGLEKVDTTLDRIKYESPKARLLISVTSLRIISERGAEG
jgi:NADPH2:quinone reductase